MRETDFIRQNEAKWRDFERILGDAGSDPEALGRVFVEATDDLSYARTRYKNRSVRVYLNGIAQRIYHSLYRKTASDRSGVSFWKEKVPIIFWHSRKELLLSFLVFVAAIGIGLLSSHYNPDFPRIILGDQYVEMTQANIDSGNPMAVYSQMDGLTMFLYIAWNNIQVSFLIFIMGVFFSLGTLMALLRNGIMVGAFISFFIQRDLFQESFLAIMLHGTLELSCIVIAGAAGLTLGRGLVFPGTYSRLQAFLISARKGITMMITITPLLVVAALIEGFATRYTQVPDVMRLLIILISLAIVLSYFVFLPSRLYQAGKTSLDADEALVNSSEPPFLDEIKSNGKILTESFYFLKRDFGKIGWLCVSGALFHCLFFGWSHGWNWSNSVQADYFLNSGNTMNQIANLLWFPDDIKSLFDLKTSPLLALPLLFLIWQLGRLVRESLYGIKEPFWTLRGLIWAALGLTAFWFPPILLLLLVFFFLPILFSAMVIQKTGEEGPAFRQSWKVIKNRLPKLYGLVLIVGLFQFVSMFLINAPLSYLFFDFILANFKSDWPLATQAPFFLYNFIAVFSLSCLLYLSLVSIALFFGSAREMNEATQLKLKIQSFGTKKRYYGLESED